MVSVKDMSLSKKLVGGFAFVVVLLSIVAILSLTSMNSMQTGTESLFKNEVNASERGGLSKSLVLKKNILFIDTLK